MRGTAGGLLTTVLLLTLLQAVVSSSAATGRLGSLLSGAGTLMEHLASPTIAGIPDLRTGAKASTTTTTTAAPAVAKTTTAPPRLPVVLEA
jgi:hypothetical protein